MARKNLTIRIDDELREKLQLVADREMRPLANQVLYFLAQTLDKYMIDNRLSYYPTEGTLMTPEEYEAKKAQS